MSFHFLHFKVEDVFKNFVQSNSGPECFVWSFGERVGKDDELEEPWVGIRCMTSRQHVDVQLGEGDGNRYYTVEVMVRSHAEDIYDIDGITVLKTARDYHAGLCGQILDPFFSDTIQEDINVAAQSVGNISINQVDQPEISTGNEARSFKTSIKFEVLCNPTT